MHATVFITRLGEDGGKGKSTHRGETAARVDPENLSENPPKSTGSRSPKLQGEKREKVSQPASPSASDAHAAAAKPANTH